MSSSHPLHPSKPQLQHRRSPGRPWWIGIAIALAGALALATPASAQRVTAQIQGRIVSKASPAAGAIVVATNLDTTAATTVVTDARGGYLLAALPPGQYLLAVTLTSGEEAVETVVVGIGQSVQFNLDVSASAVSGSETIVVAGAVTENKTSEVATNISREQLRSLPQNSRNFLNFALLAPGVRGSTDELNQSISSGGLEARQTNVFIDGLSLKSNILQGGVVGQDASRGNPFPQLAVGGFRVLTQNFKAEYEQAGTAVISSVTRSGGNEVHGEVFGSLQTKQLVAKNPYVEKNMLPKPDYSRAQVGGLLSGPIVKNKLFALATYEGNYQDRSEQVTIGNRTPENLARFGQYEGSFTSPFREHLAFAKVSYVPDVAQTFDLSANLRRETDVRSFGGISSFETAENVRNNVFATALRHQFRTCSDLVNEATAQFLLAQWNPSVENAGLVGREYQGVVRVGGRDSEQDIQQRTIMLRDDVTLPPVDAAGEHLFKVGAKLALQNYDVTKTQFGNPLFRYRVDAANNLTFDQPFEASFGAGEPNVTSDNTQIGLYAQDDWQVNHHLTFNVGLRWDIETNPLNNDYETPAAVRAAVTELATTVAAMNGPDFFDVDNYLTDGSDRSIFFGAVQPRLGFSYDLLGDQRIVVFGGAGRYYDRTLFNTGYDERYRLQYGVRLFRFSSDGAMRDGQQTIVWDDSYLSRDGLQGLINSGIAPNPEIFLLENDTRPLHTDQYSFGVRQVVGDVNLSATFSHIRGENGVGFYPANRAKSGNRDFVPVPGNFGNVLISADDIQTRFTGVYLTAERAYRDDSPWGASATYTLGWSKVRGGDFNFDFPTIKDTPLTPGNSDERHRLVVSGIVGLPQGFKASTLVQLGTGLPYDIADASAGFGPNFKFRRNGGRAQDDFLQDDFIQFSQVDVRLTKDFVVTGDHRASISAEVFNLFNSYNYGGYEGFLPPTAEPANPNFGKPTKLIGTTRAFQFGMSYGF
jgi:TonB dependent receptor/Carboxypeptidase regulatory-like domain